MSKCKSHYCHSPHIRIEHTHTHLFIKRPIKKKQLQEHSNERTYYNDNRKELCMRRYYRIACYGAAAAAVVVAPAPAATTYFNTNVLRKFK